MRLKSYMALLMISQPLKKALGAVVYVVPFGSTAEGRLVAVKAT
jgi:predicted nucleotidyltransferase